MPAVPVRFRLSLRTVPFSRCALVAALLAVALAAFPAPGWADTNDDGQLWLSGVASGPLGLPGHERFLGWLDVHTRFGDDISELSTTIVRPALGWRVSDKFDLFVGYARVDTLRQGGPDTGEHRFWQQASFVIAKPFGGALTGRSRLEERWDERGDDVGWRLRQFFRYARRFEGTRWSLVAFDEIFFAFNDTDWGAEAGFDQNRLFLGAAFHFTDVIRVEGGYLNQFIDRPGTPNQANHALSLNLFATR